MSASKKQKASIWQKLMSIFKKDKKRKPKYYFGTRPKQKKSHFHIDNRTQTLTRMIEWNKAKQIVAKREIEIQRLTKKEIEKKLEAEKKNLAFPDLIVEQLKSEDQAALELEAREIAIQKIWHEFYLSQKNIMKLIIEGLVKENLKKLADSEIKSQVGTIARLKSKDQEKKRVVNQYTFKLNELLKNLNFIKKQKFSKKVYHNFGKPLFFKDLKGNLKIEKTISIPSPSLNLKLEFSKKVRKFLEIVNNIFNNIGIPILSSITIGIIIALISDRLNPVNNKQLNNYQYSSDLKSTNSNHRIDRRYEIDLNLKKHNLDQQPNQTNTKWSIELENGRIIYLCQDVKPFDEMEIARQEYCQKYVIGILDSKVNDFPEIQTEEEVLEIENVEKSESYKIHIKLEK